MAAICLSPVLALRCLGLSHIQEAVSLVPVGLEVVFSLGLIFAGRDAGRIRYLLVAEGLAHLLLAVLSFLSHVVPVFQNSLAPFEALDIVIGGTSFVPVLLYTTFLYLFSEREFFPHLPKRFTLVAKTFLLAMIPIIVVTNEIGSFIGIEYRRDPGLNLNNPNVYYLLGGPGLTPHEFARELLSSASLALLIVVQGLTFLLFFIRLASGFVKQRNIEDRAATEREGVLFRGLGWLTVGMKLSMCETAFGWVTPSFGLIFTRRVMRMIGRACIIIGVVKGPERREEFIILNNGNGGGFLSGTRKIRVSGLRLHISTPTLMETSMSQRLSRMTLPQPFARSDSDPEQIPSTSRRTSFVPLGPSIHKTGTKARPTTLILRRSTDDRHVTIIQSLGRAPTLVLNRFSTGLPSGDAIAAMSEKLRSDPVSAMVPPPLSDAAPLTAPLPRIHFHPPEDHASISWSDKGRRGPDASVRVRHRRPVTSPIVDSGAMQSRRPPHSMPSSPRGPFPLLPAPAAMPLGTSQRAPAPEDRAHALRSSMQSERNLHRRDNSTVSGISTEWIASEDDDSREAYIKIVGAVRPRVTPNQTYDVAVRDGIAPDPRREIAEPPAPPPPASEQGSYLVRKDSGVLGKDDLVRVRRAKSAH